MPTLVFIIACGAEPSTLPAEAPSGPTDMWSEALARFDMTGDGGIDADEWARFGKEGPEFTSADRNDDARIDAGELRRHLWIFEPRQLVDLELDPEERARLRRERGRAPTRRAEHPFFSGSVPERPPRQGPPNVLLVSLDTVRADHLGLYGYERDTAPNLTRWAARGATFEQAFSQANESAYSHAAILVGRYPSEIASPQYHAYAIPEEAQTLPEILAVYGYQTAGFVAGGHVDGGFGFAQGFEHFSAEEGFASLWHTTPKAMAWLDESDPQKPWFAFVHGYDSHRPYVMPAPFYHLYAQGAGSGLAESIVQHSARSERVFRGRFYPRFEQRWFQHAAGSFILAPDTYDEIAELAATNPEAGVRLSEFDINHLHAHYDSTIAYWDLLLGAFLDGMEARGHLDNTLVIVLSDHGEDLLDHDYVNHRTALTDSCVRTPLVMWGSGVPSGARSEALVQAVDVVPTVLAAAEAELPAGARGRSLFEVLSSGEGTDGVLLEGVMDMVALRTETHKLVATEVPLHEHEATATLRDRPIRDRTFRLYDLDKDPGELVNRLQNPSDEDLAIAEELRRRLVALRADIELGTHSLAPGDVDPEVLEQMRKAGYWTKDE